MSEPERPGGTWADRVKKSSASVRGRPRPGSTPGLSRSDSTPRDESTPSSSALASRPQTSNTTSVAGQSPITAPSTAPGNVWAIPAAAAKVNSELRTNVSGPVRSQTMALAKSTGGFTIDSGRDSSFLSSSNTTPRAWGKSSNPPVTQFRGSSSANTSRTEPSSTSGAGDTNQHTVLEQMGNVSLVAVGPTPIDRSRIRPMRPEQEQKVKGPVIKVRANHFQVTFNAKSFPLTVYHYDVVIVPKVGNDNKNASPSELSETTVPDRLLHTVWRKFEDEYNVQLGARMPFDGKKNCYTVDRLKFGGNSVWSGEFKMDDPDDDGKKRTFRVQLKFANEIPTGIMWTYLRSEGKQERVELPQDVIQALDVALRYSPSLKYTPCNRSFYSNLNPHSISKLLELWFGHNQSLLLGRSEKAWLNVDMANKAFIRVMPVVDLFDIIIRKPLKNWTSKEYKKGNDFLKGKLLQYCTVEKRNGKYERRCHTFVCNGILEENSKFEFSINGVLKSIEQHFEESKGIKLQHSDWPVVHVGNKNMTNYVPLELLKITSQPYKGKLEAKDTSEMIKGAAKPPPDRFRRIKNSRDGSGFEKCSIMNDFGMRVERNMLEMDAKILPLPEIAYRSKGDVSKTPLHNDGKFKVEKFLRPAEVPSVAVVNVSGNFTPENAKEIRKFLEDLGKEAENVGMTSKDARIPVRSLFANAEVFDVKGVAGRAISPDLNTKIGNVLTAIKKKKYGLGIVLVGKDGNEYPAVKAEAEVNVGILTQCVKWSTLWKGGNQVIFNILLKINAKLGGVNFELSSETMKKFNFMQEPIMFLGADVTHPAPNSKSPSIAAITASYDLSGIRYQMRIQAQNRKDENPLSKDKEKEKATGANEVIVGIDKFIVDMIKYYWKHNEGKWPARIVMFRDGVSEGQFPAIKESEYYNGVKKACEIIENDNPEFHPKITFVVVKKRHHTRFMPVKQSDGVKPKFNVPPGTVVDHTITHPTEMEFFLTSHVGIQGTSKPTRYHVIHDDNNFSMDQLEKLTYYLCYTFVRCTQPVSYPAPTYYAHLAAFRARALLDNGAGVEEPLEDVKQRMTILPDVAEDHPMFFV